MSSEDPVDEFVDDKWQVGEVIALVDHSKVYRRTVKRILKRYIELSDGSTWKHQGSPYPTIPYPQSHIKKWTAEHETSWARRRAIEGILHAITQENLEQLPLEKLVALATQITEGMKP